jgi:hypothetical protein
MKYDLTKLGYVKDAGHKAAKFALHGRAAATVSSFSAESFEGSILDQNNTSGCTGHGSSQWLEVAYKVAGKPLPFRPSPGGIYAVTRMLDRAAATDPGQALAALQDCGGMPSDVIVGVSTFGVRPLVLPSPLGFQSDIDSSNVCAEEKLAQLETAANAILGAARRIEPTAGGFAQTLAAAIQKTGSAGLGIYVDTAFENFAQGAPPVSSVNLNDPNVGGHWIAATSFYTLPNGKLVFRGPNSWTPQWGSAGHWEETEDALAQACSDCYVLYL